MIHIMSTQYNAEHEALELYMSGCKQNCPGCHNPETHAFGQGHRWEQWLKMNTYKLKHPGGTFKRVWIMGGEPLDQNLIDLAEFVFSLHKANPELELWLWTSKELEAVPATILKHMTFVKTGRYSQQATPASIETVYDTTSPSLRLASNNQQLRRIHHE